jgi:hypothetical protein
VGEATDVLFVPVVIDQNLTLAVGQQVARAGDRVGQGLVDVGAGLDDPSRLAVDGGQARLSVEAGPALEDRDPMTETRQQ